jgi:Arc/MetJ-type ribon-helix-helix transcriptional regulator
MNSDKLETFIERNALDRFDATRDMWVVIEDSTLEDLDNSVEVKAFSSKADAVRYARARANGNVDHRVLRVTEQVLVVATRNEL